MYRKRMATEYSTLSGFLPVPDLVRRHASRRDLRPEGSVGSMQDRGEAPSGHTTHKSKDAVKEGK